MKTLTKSLVVASSAALVLSVAACGDKQPAGKFTDDQACTVAVGSLSKFTTAMLPWLYPSTSSDSSTPPAPDYSAMYDGNDLQQKLKSQAAEVSSDATAFTAALKAKDEAKLRSLQSDAKTKADDMIGSCEAAGWKKSDTIVELRKILDKTPDNALPAAPSTSAVPTSSAAPKPVALTPAGATVKVGEAVTFNYPAPRNGYSTPITFTVTKIDKARPGEIKVQGRDAEIKQFFYIRAKAVQTREENGMDAVPIYDVSPHFTVTMSDGAKNGQMSGDRDFGPCHEKTDRTEGEFCVVWGSMSESGTISSVALTGVQVGAKDGAPLYTWKND
ncbi:hypothetical protein [Gordonia sp. (in: high G+C Gram-positive bacteria)]|uniref:hypothetical protein n=1 Tax=Gordonia sp. (in: high G+C Gram-positive bacteria) TaxID=84139 RepID=UPI0039E60A74